jgi:hypothetical protein
MALGASDMAANITIAAIDNLFAKFLILIVLLLF